MLIRLKKRRITWDVFAAMSAVLVTFLWAACGESEVPPAVESAMEMERGIELLGDGHLEQARAAFGSAIDKDRQNAEAYARRGFVSLALDDARGAMADLNRALDIDPDLALGYNFRGMAYAMIGDDDRAILELTRAVSLAPTMSEAYFNRARVYLQSEDPDPKAALGDLDTVVELEPENPLLYLIRAQVHLILGNAVEAEADLLQVMSLSSDDNELAAARRLLAGIR